MGAAEAWRTPLSWTIVSEAEGVELAEVDEEAARSHRVRIPETEKNLRHCCARAMELDVYVARWQDFLQRSPGAELVHLQSHGFRYSPSFLVAGGMSGSVDKVTFRTKKKKNFRRSPSVVVVCDIYDIKHQGFPFCVISQRKKKECLK
jgi:hypothetical protein